MHRVTHGKIRKGDRWRLKVNYYIDRRWHPVLDPALIGMPVTGYPVAEFARSGRRPTTTSAQS